MLGVDDFVGGDEGYSAEASQVHDEFFSDDVACGGGDGEADAEDA